MIKNHHNEDEYFIKHYNKSPLTSKDNQKFIQQLDHFYKNEQKYQGQFLGVLKSLKNIFDRTRIFFARLPNKSQIQKKLSDYNENYYASLDNYIYSQIAPTKVPLTDFYEDQLGCIFVSKHIRFQGDKNYNIKSLPDDKITQENDLKIKNIDRDNEIRKLFRILSLGNSDIKPQNTSLLSKNPKDKGYYFDVSTIEDKLSFLNKLDKKNFMSALNI